jgi:MFS family permease
MLIIELKEYLIINTKKVRLINVIISNSLIDMEKKQPEVDISRYVRRVALASTLGTVLEYYDFILAATAAATVWPILYFSGLPFTITVFLTLLSYAEPYLARPLGAFIFGNIGDKLGRKSTLLFTLILMGIAMFGIAGLPTKAQIGFTAPILLLLLRILFGLGLGGEYGGALSWIGEYVSKFKWRSLWVSLIPMSLPVGIGLAYSAFAITALITGPAFISIGWRIPFAVGGVLIIIAFIIRFLTEDSPMFREVARRGLIDKSPAINVFKGYGKTILLLAVMILPYFTVGIVSTLPYSTIFLAQIGYNVNLANLDLAIASFLMAPFLILFAYLGDKYHKRKTIWIISNALIALLAYPFFILLETKNFYLILLAYFVYFGLSIMIGGIMGPLLVENFPTKYRYSGSGITYQLCGFIAGIFSGFITPLIITSFGGYVTAWPYIADLIIAIQIVSILISIFIVHERPAEELPF